MKCHNVKEWLSPFLDGELEVDKAEALQAHLEQCAECAGDLEEQRQVINALQQADPGKDITAPAALQEATLSKLRSKQSTRPGRNGRVIPLFRRPLAVAASIALLAGTVAVTELLVTRSARTVQATTIDYSILLDGLPRDFETVVTRFLKHYKAKPIPAVKANAAAPNLSFLLAERLPGGFELQQAYHLQFDHSDGVAAMYRRDGEPLVLLFHPVVDDEHLGTYEESPCIVGEHHGHEVQVGAWRLLHFMGPTTCHCVLTKLGPGQTLPDIVEEIIAPNFTPDTGDPHHNMH